MHDRRPPKTTTNTGTKLKILSKNLLFIHYHKIFVLLLWQLHIASALYLQQVQQQQPVLQQQQSAQQIAPLSIKAQQQAAVANAAASAAVGANGVGGQQIPIELSGGAIGQVLGQIIAQQAVNSLASSSPSLASSSPTAQINNNNNNGPNQTTLAVNTGGGGGANSVQFMLKLFNDNKNQIQFNLIPFNYTNLYEPRIELRYQSKYPYVSLDERTPNNTVVAAIVVNDEDSGPNGETTLGIEHGNELGHFKLVSTSFTNTIQVNGAPLSKQRNPEYNLTIVARDHGSPPKSSSSNLIIRLYASPYSSSSNNAPLEAQPSSKPPVTDLMYVGAMLVIIFAALIFLIISGCALVQRPKNKPHKGPPPITRPRSGTSTRTLNYTDQCSAYHCSGV